MMQDHFAMCFSRAIRRRLGPKPDRHGDGKAPVCAPKAHEIGPLQVAPALMCGGSERVTKHQPPYPHRTHPQEVQPRTSRHQMTCNAVPPGLRKESEATAMDRQPDPDPAQTSASRFDGVLLRVPDDPQFRNTLRPIAGRSVPSGTREP